MKKTKRMIVCSLLVAVSLALFSIELLIPSFPFCPGAKIGLANIVTLFMLSNKKYFKTCDCLLVLISRCFLSALLTGRMISIAFSLMGGVSAFVAMVLINLIIKCKSTIPMSITGAVFHNLAQVLVAICIYGTFSALYYIPSLFLIGVLCGVLTGLCVDFINKIKLYKLF